MPFQIDENLHARLMPLAWLVGRWEGTGRASYPGTEDYEFGQQIDFAHNGEDYLHYLSQTFELGADGRAVRPLSMETGFWRPKTDGTLEAVLTRPEGYAEVWYGEVAGAKVELATDAVVRTATAADYAAGQRMYGLVDGDLLWALDKTAGGHPLQSAMWARLQRA